MIPRKAYVEITYIQAAYEDSSASETANAIARYTKGFTYTDPATGESDSMSLELSNCDSSWLNSWFPKIKDKLLAKIYTEAWDSKQKTPKVFDCGKFCLDDFSLSGPTMEISIEGVSVPEANAFRCTERSKTWEEVTLKEIAEEISKRYSLELFYEGDTIKIATLEQNNQTDCNFLTKVCEDYFMAIKVYYGKLIIYNKEMYEDKPAVTSISMSEVSTWKYNTSLTDQYDGATISYSTGEKEDDELTYSIGDVSEGKRVLYINEKVDSLADAQKRVYSKLNQENSKVETVSITMPSKAEIDIIASNTVELIAFGKISGKYFVDKVKRSLTSGAGYELQLELHKCQPRIGVTEIN